MKLSIKERIAVSKLCNPEFIQERLKVRFDYLGWSIAQGINQKVYLTAYDTEQVNLQFTDQGLVWEEDKDPLKEIDFLGIEKEFLNQLLKQLSDAKQIDNETGAIYGIFVIGKGPQHG